MVKQDRTDNPNVLADMIRRWKANMHRSAPVVTEEVYTGTEAYHELWDDTADLMMPVD